MSDAPEKLFRWNFQTQKGGWEKGWGGYAHQSPMTPIDDRERNTGAEYIRKDIADAAMAAALELVAEEQRRKADHWMKRAHEIGAGDGRHPADGRVAGHLSAEASIRAMITDDARAALDAVKADIRAEGIRIGAAREKMRVLTEWLNEDEDNGELLVASLDADTIETLRAILAIIPVTTK